MPERTMEPISCPNPDCRVAETGKCVEGFEIGLCPHQRTAATTAKTLMIEVSDNENIADKSQSDIPVAGGNILNIDEASDILCSGPSRVVTLIGPLASGKTTLSLSLYEAFQHAPFGRWSFAGSLTLPAFEKCCHLSRIECGMTSPETRRTSLSDGLGFLHLAMHSNETGRIELLISDRSGETYTMAADHREECENLYEVSRADLVLFLVDGKKLAGDERHGVKHDITIMATALFEEGVLSKRQQVGIVLTKYDLVLSSGVQVQAEKDFDNLVANFRRKFEPKLAEIKSFKIAARHENGQLEQRFGILDILEESLRPQYPIDYEFSSVSISDRAFLRLQVAEGGEK
jgi:hypothetical protein